MDTKLKGSIAEQIVICEALKRGWGVAIPVGDRLPYDLIFDVQGGLVRIQIKHAWLDKRSGNFVIDNRRTKTNRRMMKRSAYQTDDFDFAIAYLAERSICYVFPTDVFVSFAGPIHMVESEKRQRKPKSALFRDAWQLILQWAACGENHT